MKLSATDRLAREEAGEPSNRLLARGRLFQKYVALFVAVVTVALLANGLIERGSPGGSQESSQYPARPTLRNSEATPKARLIRPTDPR